MKWERLKNRVAGHEGCKLKPYLDTVGKTTIGYGRNLDDVGITQAEAKAMLETDLRIAEREHTRKGSARRRGGTQARGGG